MPLLTGGQSLLATHPSLYLRQLDLTREMVGQSWPSTARKTIPSLRGGLTSYLYVHQTFTVGVLYRLGCENALYAKHRT